MAAETVCLYPAKAATLNWDGYGFAPVSDMLPGDVAVSFPFQLVIDVLADARVQLLRPIVVSLIRDEAGVLAHDDEGMTYGLGESIREAVADYAESLVIDLQLLVKDRDLLASPLARRLQAIERHVRLRG